MIHYIFNSKFKSSRVVLCCIEINFSNKAWSYYLNVPYMVLLGLYIFNLKVDFGNKQSVIDWLFTEVQITSIRKLKNPPCPYPDKLQKK